MARRSPRATPRTTSLPACYAMVLPGLETVAADEISANYGGDVRRTGPGLVVFRVPEPSRALLQLRTTEDVFLLAWGTDKLTYRARDLESIRHWTARDVDWDQLLRIHHTIRPKPSGRPSYHLVTQMTGTHGYRRIDARKALAEGLRGKLPASWREVEEDAAVEIWLTIHGATGICGLRLSDRTMRHRVYKAEHLPASLRPTMAAALVRLAELAPNMAVLDPMCGAGTILAESLAAARARGLRLNYVLGGDREKAALRAAGGNLRHAGHALLARWDARRLPLADQSVGRIVSNPPFGKQLASPEEIAALYERILAEFDRVLQPDGRAVLLVSDAAALRAAARRVGWRPQHNLRVRILGQPAFITVWQPGPRREKVTVSAGEEGPHEP